LTCDEGLSYSFTYLYPQQIDVSAVAELQRQGIPCVNFFCDNVREYSAVPNQYRPFALHWVPEFEALAMYKDARLPHIHAPMPCWVAPEQRYLPSRETEPSTFMGSADSLRRILLAGALDRGANFTIRGPGVEPNGTGVRSQLRSIQVGCEVSWR